MSMSPQHGEFYLVKARPSPVGPTEGFVLSLAASLYLQMTYTKQVCQLGSGLDVVPGHPAPRQV